MYQYNSSGQKVPIVENFKFAGKPDQRREYYTSGNSGKSKKWLWIVLAVVVGVLIVVGLWMLWKSKKEGGGSMSAGFGMCGGSSKMGTRGKQNYGFSFY